MVRNLPANPGDTSSILGFPHAAGQLSLHDGMTEPVQVELEKAHTQKQRPTAVKNLKKKKRTPGLEASRQMEKRHPTTF